MYYQKKANMAKYIGNTLAKLMKERKLTSSELARLTGVAQPVIYRIASGESDNPKIDTLLPLANYFEISIDALIGRSLDAQTTVVETGQHRGAGVPLIHWDLLTSDNNINEIENIQHIQTRKQHHSKNFALEVKDDIYFPKFPKGTFLVFDAEATAKNEDFILVIMKEKTSATLKQILIDGEDRYLKSPNPEFRTIFINNEEQIKIIGILIETYKCYKNNDVCQE